MKERFVFIKPHLPLALAQAGALLGCDQGAADLVQQVLERSLKTPHFPAHESQVKAWFLRSIHNAGIDTLRRNKKELSFDETTSEQHPDGAQLDAGEPLSDLIARQQMQQRVQQALRCLDWSHREILVMREMNECSYAEIATVLDIEPGTVMSRLHRARKALRQALMDYAPTNVDQYQHDTQQPQEAQ